MALMPMVMRVSNGSLPQQRVSPYIPRMSHEVHGLAAFYASASGIVAQRMLQQGLRGMWPQLHGMNVLGLGWAMPYLPLWSGQAARSLALVPAPIASPAPPPPAAVMPEALLPLPDLSMDRIVLVHALEMVQAPEALLRECWRVLRDDGKLIVVVPNRLGAWSLFDHTPFGQGRPWSRGQLLRLLEGRLFRVARVRPALFVPPLPWPWALTGAAMWEGLGRMALPRLSGVVMAEAVKDVLGAVPMGEGFARMVRLPALHGVVKQL
jgi:SAM-dependent methyltransferase